MSGQAGILQAFVRLTAPETLKESRQAAFGRENGKADISLMTCISKRASQSKDIEMTLVRHALS